MLNNEGFDWEQYKNIMSESYKTIEKASGSGWVPPDLYGGDVTTDSDNSSITTTIQQRDIIFGSTKDVTKRMDEIKKEMEDLNRVVTNNQVWLKCVAGYWFRLDQLTAISVSGKYIVALVIGGAGSTADHATFDYDKYKDCFRRAGINI